MTTFEVLHNRRDEILQLAAKHGAADVRVFGSVARHEDSPESDIDFVVRTQAETSRWFPAGLIVELENLLGRRVEVVIERAISPYIRDRILSESLPL